MRTYNLIVLLLLWAHTSVQAQPVSEGSYIATLGDCAACHTRAGGAPLAGGVPFSTPVGVIYSTNITPDATHGMGAYTLAEFKAVMRSGVAKDGHRLYPAMPYTAYAKMTDADLSALYQYLLQEVRPQAVANRAADIPWPLNMRWPLALWNWMFHDEQEFVPTPSQSAEWNRGAYLVQGAAHCGTCHTPRGMAMQEQALTDAQPEYLSGGSLAGWYAGDIRGAQYSVEDLVSILQTGRSPTHAASGPMTEVVTHSSQYFSADDLISIATYVTSLTNTAPTATAALAETNVQGQANYAMYCGTCHGRDGQGREQVVPALVGNASILANNPSSMINVLLQGGQTATTQTHLGYDMPAYAWKFNDQQVADLLNFIRASWGNQAQAVSVAQVKAQRQLR